MCPTNSIPEPQKKQKTKKKTKKKQGFYFRET